MHKYMSLLAYLDFAYGPILTNKGAPLPLVNTFNGIANSRIGFFKFFSIHHILFRVFSLKGWYFKVGKVDKYSKYS